LLLAQYAYRRLKPTLGALAFPALWTSIGYVVSLLSPHGTGNASAYSQVAEPILIQGAALFGIWGIGFLLSLIASALALALRDGWRAAASVVLAAGLLVGNVAYGAARLGESQGAHMRVGLAVDDTLAKLGVEDTVDAARAVAEAYAKAAQSLAKDGATTVVLPEKVAVLKPEYRGEVLRIFADASRRSGARIIVGFKEDAPVPRNVALVFSPTGEVATYSKRHLIPDVERFVPGDRPGLLGGGHAVAICKDMDFQRTIREDALHHITVMFVPAWDFGADGWLHARMAILRGVENGFAIARSAREGLLTVSDANGRVLARAQSDPAQMVLLSADMPAGKGDTLYLKIGDAFAWFSVALVAGLWPLALRKNTSAQSR
jgi:apolipoprotein N-acyltransferase